jgi:AbrB family looped-hinge helix DNA binding protein
MRITSKGQVTIPQAIREKVGLLPGTEVEFEVSGKTVIMRAAGKSRKPSRGDLLVRHLRAHGGDIKMTTDEIMALTRGYERRPRR